MSNQDNDLRKSHSVWSNIKLTFVNIIGIIGVSCIWFSLIINNTKYLLVSSIITVIYIILINLFKR